MLEMLLVGVLGIVYLFIGARIAKIYERLYPKVNRDELKTFKERFLAFLLMPQLFFIELDKNEMTKWSDKTPWEALLVKRSGYYQGVALFWFPAIICQAIVAFPYLLFVVFIQRAALDQSKHTLSPVETIPIKEQQKRVPTAAQQLAADGRLAAELGRQLMKGYGPLEDVVGNRRKRWRAVMMRRNAKLQQKKNLRS